MKIERISTPKEFTPIELKLTFQSQEEFDSVKEFTANMSKVQTEAHGKQIGVSPSIARTYHKFTYNLYSVLDNIAKGNSDE